MITGQTLTDPTTDRPTLAHRIGPGRVAPARSRTTALRADDGAFDRGRVLDGGELELAAAIRAYRETRFDGIVCPAGLPSSRPDPHGERLPAFAIGHTRGLLQTA